MFYSNTCKVGIKAAHIHNMWSDIDCTATVVSSSRRMVHEYKQTHCCHQHNKCFQDTVDCDNKFQLQRLRLQDSILSRAQLYLKLHGVPCATRARLAGLASCFSSALRFFPFSMIVSTAWVLLLIGVTGVGSSGLKAAVEWGLGVPWVDASSVIVMWLGAWNIRGCLSERSAFWLAFFVVFFEVGFLSCSSFLPPTVSGVATWAWSVNATMFSCEWERKLTSSSMPVHGLKYCSLALRFCPMKTKSFLRFAFDMFRIYLSFSSSTSTSPAFLAEQSIQESAGCSEQNII